MNGADNDDIHTNYYVTLVDMFPNVDEKYIRQMCLKKTLNDLKSDQPLLMLINHLINYEEDDWVRKLVNDLELSEKLEVQELESLMEQKLLEEQRNKQLLQQFLREDETFISERTKILENVLPDASPEELKNLVETNYGDVEALQMLVESKLDERNYERRDVYYAKLKSRERIRYYLTEFKVELFVLQFPKPFEHFENPDRRTSSVEQALIFLNSKYDAFDSTYLEEIFKHYNNNLTLADAHLQKICNINQNIQWDDRINDIALLREIAFIQNKMEIKKYLEVMEKKEEREMQLLRRHQLLLECLCCFDEVKPYESVECDNQHIFCKNCIFKGVEVAISEGQTYLKCFKGCQSEIGLDILRKVLPETTFEIFLNKRQEQEVNAAISKNLTNCPFCSYAMELDSQIKIFTCKNPECMKISCRICKKLNHLPIKCEDVLDEQKCRLFVEEEMSKALIRYCYNCNIPFVKDSGCNKMQCQHCKAMMCYLCKQPITDYNHFHNSRCRTHINTEMFHKEQVEVGRILALEKIHEENPNFELPDF